MKTSLLLMFVETGVACLRGFARTLKKSLVLILRVRHNLLNCVSFNLFRALCSPILMAVDIIGNRKNLKGMKD